MPNNWRQDPLDSSVGRAEDCSSPQSKESKGEDTRKKGKDDRKKIEGKKWQFKCKKSCSENAKNDVKVL